MSDKKKRAQKGRGSGLVNPSSLTVEAEMRPLQSNKGPPLVPQLHESKQ